MELIQPNSAEQRNAYHQIREGVLWKARGRTDYDRDHPDEHEPGNFPLLLTQSGDPVGVVRIDIDGSTAFFRRDAISKRHQRKGLGRALLQMAEDFARDKGAWKLRSHVASAKLQMLALIAITSFSNNGCATIGGLAAGGSVDDRRFETIDTSNPADLKIDIGDRLRIRTDSGTLDGSLIAWIDDPTLEPSLVIEQRNESAFYVAGRRDTLLVSELTQVERKQGPLAAFVLGGLGLAVDLAVVSWIVSAASNGAGS